jgi:glycosyltransferase involved in cell wall biosynthesis
MVLASEAILLGRLFRVPVIVDAHNAGLRPGKGTNLVLMQAAAAIARCAHLTIVSNPGLESVVRNYGGRPFVLPDEVPTLSPSRTPSGLRGLSKVTVVSTFADDEPYEAVIEAARTLGPDTAVYITGNPTAKARRLRKLASPNVVFTGFLPDEDYVGLLGASDVVVDLTTRKDCLVCGAYEAVGIGRPLVLSDSDANRNYFSRGAVYTDNTAADIATCIRRALGDLGKLEVEVRQLRTELRLDWARRIQEFSALLQGLITVDSHTC